MTVIGDAGGEVRQTNCFIFEVHRCRFGWLQLSVTLQNGLSFYEGSPGENLVESQIQDSPEARSFSLSEPQPVRNLNCADDATFIMKVWRPCRLS